MGDSTRTTPQSAGSVNDSAPAPSADNKPTPGMLRGLSKIAADLAAYRNAPAPSSEPPAQAATDDRIFCGCGDAVCLMCQADAKIEQQTREIAALRVLARGWENTAGREQEQRIRAEAERDALRECVRTADAMRRDGFLPAPDSGLITVKQYDAARAKVKP